MKLAIRAFVLALVATGAVASTHIARASQPAVSARASFMPVPTCPPGDPNGCGICQFMQCPPSAQGN